MVCDEGISETAVLVFRRSVNQQGFTQREVMVLSDARVDGRLSPQPCPSSAISVAAAVGLVLREPASCRMTIFWPLHRL